MKNENTMKVVEWRPIHGYFYNYRISSEAKIEREVGPKIWKPIKTYFNQHAKQYRVKLKKLDGGYRTVSVKRLLADAFLGGYKSGMVLVTKNGMKTDISLENLHFVTCEELGKLTGGSGNRLPIKKIDRDGNVINLYSSISEASRRDFISCKAIRLRCKGKIKNEFALNGFTYRYDI